MGTNVNGITTLVVESQPASFEVKMRPNRWTSRWTSPASACFCFSAFGFAGLRCFFAIFEFRIDRLGSELLSVKQHGKLITTRVRQPQRVNGKDYIHLNKTLGKVQTAGHGRSRACVFTQISQLYRKLIPTYPVVKLYENRKWYRLSGEGGKSKDLYQLVET